MINKKCIQQVKSFLKLKIAPAQHDPRRGQGARAQRRQGRRVRPAQAAHGESRRGVSGDGVGSESPVSAAADDDDGEVDIVRRLYALRLI